jgi:hypothetical protein
VREAVEQGWQDSSLSEAALKEGLQVAIFLRKSQLEI